MKVTSVGTVSLAAYNNARTATRDFTKFRTEMFNQNLLRNVKFEWNPPKILDTILHASRKQYLEHLLFQNELRILHRWALHSAASVLLVPWKELNRSDKRLKNCYLRKGCTNPRRQFAKDTKFCPVVVITELASYHPPFWSLQSWGLSHISRKLVEP